MDRYEWASRLQVRVEVLTSHVNHGRTTAALAQISAANEELGELAMALLEQGAREGMTQRRMADLLDVPASTLRGLRQGVTA